MPDAPWAAAAKLVAEILTRYGLDCPTPDDGDLDDVEVERWAACCEVAERVMAAERERCASIVSSVPCEDATIMRIWRECGLPEWFLGNGGTNHTLVTFVRRIREADLT